MSSGSGSRYDGSSLNLNAAYSLEDPSSSASSSCHRHRGRSDSSTVIEY